MPTTLLEYRLRVRNGSTTIDPDGTADVLVVTSVRGGAAPYLPDPPQGDGLQFDPIKGTVRSGTYTVEVIDAITSGTSRIVTTVLTDNQNRQQLLSRRAYIEFRTDGGSWQTLMAGYVVGIRLTNALSYQFSIGDSRRIEQTLTLFNKDSRTYFPNRGTIFGGPVTNVALGFGAWYTPFVDRKGWRFRITSIESGGIVSLQFVNGYLGSTGSVTGKWNEVALPRTGTSTGPTRIDEVAAKYVINEVARTASGDYYRTSGISYVVKSTSGSYLYDVRPLCSAPGTLTLTGGYGGNPHLRAEWGSNTLPSVGQEFLVSCITDAATEESPVYLIGHPVDVVAAIYNHAQVQIDAATFATLKQIQGSFFSIICRFTSPIKMVECIEKITGPFGIGLRVDGAGKIAAFSSRIKNTTEPAVTVTTNMLCGDGSNVFDNDESTVVTSVVLETEVYGVYNSNTEDPSGQRPFDGVAVSKESYTVLNADVSTFSSKEIKYSFQGMITSDAVFLSQASFYIYSIVGEIFDRYGRGVVGGSLQVLRGTGADSVQVGDEIYVQVAQLPNNGKRIGDDPSVGARIMQVVRRTETPRGPEFRVLDSGTYNQPSIAPTITIAASTEAATTVAAFTITNASTINANAYLGVAVQWKVSATTPTTDGVVFTRYEATTVPVAATSLPPVEVGSRVWVRARTEQQGIRPSAWTAWTSVLLATTTGPSTLTASSIKRTAVTLQWTNSSTVHPIEVYIAPTGSTVTSPQYLVGTAAAASTQFTHRLLSGPSVAYTAAVRYQLSNGAYSTAITTTFTTNSTEDAVYRPAGIAIVQNSSIQDASSTQGVPVALWAYDQALSIEVQRAPDNGSDAPNTALATTIATLQGSTRVFSDTNIPVTTTKWWYRARHVLGGFAESSYTCWKGSMPIAINYELSRPDAVVPLVTVEVSETTTTGTLTLDITDPQCRVDAVQFRYRTNNGFWSAWATDTTVPYSITQTLPATGMLDMQYQVLGFNGASQYTVIDSGQESFDIGTSSADMVSVVGTFTSAGVLQLAFAADTDTASIRYAASTVSQPSTATVEAQTAINARNYAVQLAGPYTEGTTVYVSVLAYTGASGTGTQSTIFEYRFIRDGGIAYTQCLARMSSSSATQLTITVTGTAPSGNPTVQLVTSPTGSATLASGAAPGVAVASGSTWVFNRGAALGPTGGAQFRAVLAGAQSDDDFIEIPEQGRDTTYIASRARVTATSETSITIRVAVIDALSALSSLISYTTQGLASITPVSPQTVTAAVSSTFVEITSPAQNYADFVVARPASGQPSGQITFTVSATGRVSDSDPVTIPSQDIGMMSVSAVFGATGAATLSFVGDSSVASFRFAVSTSAFPTLGTVQASTVINARNSSQSLAGPYALGTSLFVSCVSYTGASGTGKESPIFQYQFIRQNTTPTIKNRQPATQVCTATTQATTWRRELGYYVPGVIPSASPTTDSGSGVHIAQVIVPRGVTLRAVRVNCYALQPPTPPGTTGDIIYVNFWRATSSGVVSSIGFTATNAYAGWQTLAVTSLSEDTTDRSYFVEIFSVWNLQIGGGSDVRVSWIESEYDKSSTDQNI